MMGNGRRVRFWEDTWCGQEPLCSSFPSLFAIAASKDAWVSELWCGPEHGEGWNPLFTRLLNDWEVEGFLSLIGKATVVDVMEDKWIWKENRDGFFSVKSYV